MTIGKPGIAVVTSTQPPINRNMLDKIDRSRLTYTETKICIEMLCSLFSLALLLLATVSAVPQPLTNETILAIHKKHPELRDLDEKDGWLTVWDVPHLVSCRFPQVPPFGDYRYVDLYPKQADLHSHLSVAVPNQRPPQINVAYINVDEDYIETWSKISFVKLPEFGIHASAWEIKATAIHAPNGKMLPKGVVVRIEKVHLDSTLTTLGHVSVPRMRVYASTFQRSSKKLYSFPRSTEQVLVVFNDHKDHSVSNTLSLISNKSSSLQSLPATEQCDCQHIWPL